MAGQAPAPPDLRGPVKVAPGHGGPTWTDRRAVEWQVARWVHWYNHDGLHSSIGRLPPN